MPKTLTPLSICRDEDCPECGWPETYAAGSAERGPDRVVCRKCGWGRSLMAPDAVTIAAVGADTWRAAYGTRNPVGGTLVVTWKHWAGTDRGDPLVTYVMVEPGVPPTGVIWECGGNDAHDRLASLDPDRLERLARPHSGDCWDGDRIVCVCGKELA